MRPRGIRGSSFSSCCCRLSGSALWPRVATVAVTAAACCAHWFSVNVRGGTGSAPAAGPGQYPHVTVPLSDHSLVAGPGLSPDPYDRMLGPVHSRLPCCCRICCCCYCGRRALMQPRDPISAAAITAAAVFVTQGARASAVRRLHCCCRCCCICSCCYRGLRAAQVQWRAVVPPAAAAASVTTAAAARCASRVGHQRGER